MYELHLSLFHSVSQITLGGTPSTLCLKIRTLCILLFGDPVPVCLGGIKCELKINDPVLWIFQPNGESLSSNKPASRTRSMREHRSSSEFQNHSYSAEENLLPSRTLPPNHHHRPGVAPARPSTVGRHGGANITRLMTRPPADRPPPPPTRPSVPPPSQPPPPPPSRAATAASKPEVSNICTYFCCWI